MDCSLPISSPWDFPGKNIWVGCHFPLQGIFPIQGSWTQVSCIGRQILSHQGSPNYLFKDLQIEPHSEGMGLRTSTYDFLRKYTIKLIRYIICNSSSANSSKSSLYFTHCSKERLVHMYWAFQVALVVKNPLAIAGDVKDMSSIPRLERFPWRRTQQPTPVFLPRESHGQRRLAGYSP